MWRGGICVILGWALLGVSGAIAEPLRYEINATIDPKTGQMTASAKVALPQSPAERRFVIDRRMTIDGVTADRGGAIVVGLTERPFPGLTVMTIKGGADGPRRLDVRWRGALERPGAGMGPASDLKRVELFLDQAWMPVSDDLSAYAATLKLRGVPASWGVVADGDWRRRGNEIHLRRAQGGVDTNLIAEPGMRLRSTGGAEIWASAHSDEAVAAVRSAAEAIIAHHRTLFGARAPGPLRIVLADRAKGPSYARGGFVVIQQAAAQAPHPLQVASVLAHELTHVWWMPPVDLNSEDYWMVEAVPTYVANRYVIGLGAGVTAADWDRARSRASKMGPVLGQGRASGDVVYRKASILLADLENRLGRPTMDRFLGELARTTPKTTKDFLEMLASADPSAARDFEAALRRDGYEPIQQPPVIGGCDAECKPPAHGQAAIDGGSKNSP